MKKTLLKIHQKNLKRAWPYKVLFIFLFTSSFSAQAHTNFLDQWEYVDQDSIFHAAFRKNYSSDSIFLRPAVVLESQLASKSLAQLFAGIDAHNMFNHWNYNLLVGIHAFNYPNCIDTIGTQLPFLLHYNHQFTALESNFLKPILQGSVAVELYDQINLKVANERMFLGNGYRSLWVSDYAGPLKHLDLNWQNKKVSYHYTLAWLNDLYQINDVRNKFSAMHYLSWQMNKHINLHFFDAVVWHYSDSVEQRGLDPNYLNPIIFFRPVEFSVGSPDNMMVGLGANINFGSHMFYYQAMLDEFFGRELFKGTGHFTTKFAMQFGVKGKQQVGPITSNYLLEYNFARPYTYSHQSTLKSYSQNGQALAHPLGGNFEEWVFQGRLIKGRWSLNLRLIEGKVGINEAGENYGANLLVSYDLRPGDYNNRILQGQLSDDYLREFTLSYTLIEKWNINVYTGYMMRKFYHQNAPQSYFTLGLRNVFQRIGWYE